MKNPITKIELDLGGKKIILTPKQAQNLKDALNELFAEKVIRIMDKEYIPYPSPCKPLRPYYWEWPRYQPNYWMTTTNGVDGKEVVYCSNTSTLKLTA